MASAMPCKGTIFLTGLTATGHRSWEASSLESCGDRPESLDNCCTTKHIQSATPIPHAASDRSRRFVCARVGLALVQNLREATPQTSWSVEVSSSVDTQYIQPQAVM